jgi:hypothetical protein
MMLVATSGAVKQKCDFLAQTSPQLLRYCYCYCQCQKFHCHCLFLLVDTTRRHKPVECIVTAWSRPCRPIRECAKSCNCYHSYLDDDDEDCFAAARLDAWQKAEYRPPDATSRSRGRRWFVGAAVAKKTATDHLVVVVVVAVPLVAAVPSAALLDENLHLLVLLDVIVVVDDDEVLVVVVLVLDAAAAAVVVMLLAVAAGVVVEDLVEHFQMVVAEYDAAMVVVEVEAVVVDEAEVDEEARHCDRARPLQ